VLARNQSLALNCRHPDQRYLTSAGARSFILPTWRTAHAHDVVKQMHRNQLPASSSPFTISSTTAAAAAFINTHH